MMALPADLAVAYLRELTWSARAVALRGAAGELLAGEEPPDGADVVSARRDGREIAVALGPGGLRGLASHDAERSLAAALSPAGDR